MIISVSGKMNSGKDLVGEIILYLTDEYYHSKVGEEASFENWRANNIHSSGYNISHKAMYEVNNTDHFVIKKFAGKLKEVVSIITGYSLEDLEKEDIKNTLCMTSYYIEDKGLRLSQNYATPEDILPVAERVKSLYKEVQVGRIDITPRYLLQQIGTEIARNINPNIWVNALMSEYKKYIYAESISGTSEVKRFYKYPNWIITDTRFPNELKAVKDRGGISIRVNREIKHQVETLGGRANVLEGHFPTNQHESETALDNAEFDYVIDNNSSIEDLVEKVKEILTKEKLI